MTLREQFLSGTRQTTIDPWYEIGVDEALAWAESGPLRELREENERLKIDLAGERLSLENMQNAYGDELEANERLKKSNDMLLLSNDIFEKNSADATAVWEENLALMAKLAKVEAERDEYIRQCREALAAANAEREKAQKWFAAKVNSEAERDRLKAAIAEHHNQRADDRCWQDDDLLYAKAGLKPHDNHVGDKAAMMVNCARFIERRCEGGKWPTYVALEAELERLTEQAGESEAVLRSLACALAVGGYNDPDFNPEEFGRKISDGIDAIWRPWKSRAEKAEAFKTFVHAWLDAHGVPADPDPGHTAETGCRISGRLEWVFAELERLKASNQRMADGLVKQALIHGCGMEVADESK